MGRDVRYKPSKVDHKVCTHCLSEKHIDLFPPNKITKDGLGSWCRACLRKVTSEWYYRNLDRERERIREYRRLKRQAAK